MANINAESRSTAGESDSQTRTVWPIDDLTKETDDAVVSGRLDEKNSEEKTVVIESVLDETTTLVVDLVRSPIRKYIFEDVRLGEYVRLSGVETEAYEYFLRCYGTGKTTGWTEDIGGDEQFIVPAAGERDGYAIIPQ
jgi:hypothetical protein